MLDEGFFMSKPGGRFIASCEFQPSLFGVQINRPHFQILRAVGAFAGALAHSTLRPEDWKALASAKCPYADRNYELKLVILRLQIVVPRALAFTYRA
jgi:hypothetical protein